MRFPSLFRMPRHQQFEIKPRYYDPVKEFVEERKALARRSEEGPEVEYSASRIRFERKKSNQGLNTSLLQLIIALVLSGLVVGWLYIGNDILYYALALVPVYFYFRFKKR